jgi:outer-membrane receptor for ferric coprogen and ferric-rhodotorulic acid
VKIRHLLLAAGAWSVAAATAQAAEHTDEAASPDAQRPEEVLVVGKSYGREVGKTVTPLKDTPNTVSVIERDQIEAQNLFTSRMRSPPPTASP